MILLNLISHERCYVLRTVWNIETRLYEISVVVVIEPLLLDNYLSVKICKKCSVLFFSFVCYITLSNFLVTIHTLQPL